MIDEPQSPIAESSTAAPATAASPAPPAAEGPSEALALSDDHLVDERISEQEMRPVLEITLEVSAELGRTDMSVREALGLTVGSIVVFGREVDQPVDVFANKSLIARAEVISIDNELGVRLTEIVTGDVEAIAQGEPD